MVLIDWLWKCRHVVLWYVELRNNKVVVSSRSRLYCHAYYLNNHLPCAHQLLRTSPVKILFLEGLV